MLTHTETLCTLNNSKLGEWNENTLYQQAHLSRVNFCSRRLLTFSASASVLSLQQ